MNTRAQQAELFGAASKLHNFDGATYEPQRDKVRLNRQLQAVWNVMRDGQWRSLCELATQSGEPEASVSARLRDLRKTRFGAHLVERRRRENQPGTFEYRVTA
jgi:hypothetical protein